MLVGATIYCLLPLGTSSVKPGSEAPNFALPDVQERRVRLSDFRGKVVLLDFWATWCGPCLEELPDLKALHEKYKDKGFTIVGLSMDEESAKAIKPFVKENEIPYPILISGGAPPEGYSVFGLPTAYLIDSKGKIVKNYIGYKYPAELEKDVSSLLASEASHARS